MSFAATWIDLERVILIKVNHKEKDKYHMIPLVCDTNELIYETQTHRHREQTCGCQGRRNGLGVLD